jgi:hypothetical protein
MSRDSYPRRTWHHKHLDKAAWGDGPWVSEPDKMQWVDRATGLDCLIVRSHSSALCGYVGVPEGHPCFGLGYEDARIPEAVHAAAHRELNFAGLCMEGLPEAYGVCHVPHPGRPSRIWWLGFDCNQAWDLCPRRMMDLDGRYESHQARRQSILEKFGIDIDARNDPGCEETYRTVRYVRERCRRMARALTNAGESGHHD